MLASDRTCKTHAITTQRDNYTYDGSDFEGSPTGSATYDVDARSATTLCPLVGTYHRHYPAAELEPPPSWHRNASSHLATGKLSAAVMEFCGAAVGWCKGCGVGDTQ